MCNMDLKSKIESVLFVSGDALHIKKLRQIFSDAKEEEVEDAVSALQESYKSRGVRVIRKDEKIQMVSAPENSALVALLVKSSIAEELTPAAIETLACVAYREPITKEEIDDLRGVNSVFSLRALAIRGLIEKTKDGAYQVTIDFLKKLGIENITDLPEYETIGKLYTVGGGAA